MIEPSTEVSQVPDWEQRLNTEWQDLTNKLDRLQTFIESGQFRSLHAVDQSLLFEQRRYMQQYRGTLTVRLARAKQTREETEPPVSP